MTLIDFIDLSSDDEILKGHEFYTGSHEVYHGIGIIELNSDSDNEAAGDDHGACGQAHEAQCQASLFDPNLFTGAAKGSQQDSEPGNGAKASASFLDGENGGVGTATSLNCHQSSTAVAVPSPSKEYRQANQIDTHSPISTFPEAAKRWKSPRLQTKHKGCCKKSVLRLAVELKSSRLLCEKTITGKRKRKNARQQNKMPSSFAPRSASRRGCYTIVDTSLPENHVVATQGEEVEPIRSLIANRDLV